MSEDFYSSVYYPLRKGLKIVGEQCVPTDLPVHVIVWSSPEKWLNKTRQQCRKCVWLSDTRVELYELNHQISSESPPLSPSMGCEAIYLHCTDEGLFSRNARHPLPSMRYSAETLHIVYAYTNCHQALFQKHPCTCCMNDHPIMKQQHNA